MSRELSTNAKNAVYSSQTNACFLVLLEISHNDLPEVIRVVNNNVAIVHNSETYLPYAFSFTPPQEEDGKIKSSSLTIENIDRVIVEFIRSINTAPTVTAKIIMSDSPDTIEAGPWSFSLTNTSFNEQTVTGELIFENYLKNYCSVVKYNNRNFPGLYA